MKAQVLFKAGEQYEYCGKKYQLTEVDGQQVQMRAVNGPPMVITQMMPQLRHAADQGRLVKTQEAPITCFPEQIIAGLSKKHAARFTVSWTYVKLVEDDYAGCLSRSKLPEMVERVKIKIGTHDAPSYSTLCGWLKLFRTAGGNSVALVPKTHRPHRKHITHQPEEIVAVIREHVGQLYWVPTPVTKTALSQSIKFAIADLNRFRPLSRQYRIPSPTTLWRIICELDAFEQTCRQKGRRKALRDQRYGAALPEPDWLYEKVEADTQLLHLFVADAKGKVIGRPYLTAFIEIKTRYIVGWHISFNPPSLDTTLMALKKSLNSDNPYAGVASLYVFDNGPEYIAEALRKVLEWLGALVTYCEPGTPNQKPHIEAFFKTWSTQIVHSMSGTTFSGLEEKGEYDPEKHVTFTLEDVTTFFARWLETYHADYHSTLNMSPNEAWAKCQESDFPPRRYSENDLKRYFWRRVSVTPSSQGRVRFSSVHWHGPAVRQLAERHPKSKKLFLYYDPSDLGEAFIYHPSYPAELFRVEAVHPHYQQGLTLHFHQEIETRKREQRSKHIYIDAQEARAQLVWEISQTNSKAERAKHHRSVERGDVTKEDLQAATEMRNIERADVNKVHQYHDDTPEEFSVER